MSLAKKCDRCGEFYSAHRYDGASDILQQTKDHGINAIMFINLGTDNKYFPSKVCDLCSTCTLDMVSAFRNGMPKTET